jgi:hypothetical protein
MKKRTGSSTLAVLALSSLLVLGTLPMVGCSAATVAQDIVNWTPALQSAVATVDSTASLLAPVDAPIFAAATVGFDTASNLLVSQCKAYLANPSASILAQIQAQIVNFQQQVNAAVLNAARIIDPASRAHATDAIQAVATVTMAILALVQSISSKTAVAQMAANSNIKLASVRNTVWRDRCIAQAMLHYGETPRLARAQVDYADAALARAGF